MIWIIYSVVFLVMTILLFLSIRERAKIRTRNYMQDLPDLKMSPFSQALANLVGTAGGIYLSLVMLTTFLDIPVPEKITMVGIYIEPLAGLSVFLAIVQPYILKIYHKLKYRF